MACFISQDLLYYLTRPLTDQEREWKMMDNRYKKTLLPPITTGPKKTDIMTKGPTKPDLNKPAFLMNQGAAALIRANRCPNCTKEIHFGHFKTEIQKKEYGISGKCVECQALATPG